MMMTSEVIPAPGVRTRERLRVAIQRTGRLADPARSLLARAGLRFREDRDRLFCHGESLPIDLLLVRDDDIPGLIADGVCDLGIVGLNVLKEQTEERRARGLTGGVSALRELGTGRCRLSVAVPQGWSYDGPQALAGRRIATSYPRLLGQWLESQGVAAETVVLSGSVEIAPRLGTADAICDLVSTGGTLAANQLREVAVIVESQAVLAGPEAGFASERAALAELLQRRFDDVLRAQESRLLMFQAPRTALDRLLLLLPDADPPTVTRLDGGSDDIALQAICREAVTWQRLEEMKQAGARGILVLPVDQMLS